MMEPSRRSAVEPFIVMEVMRAAEAMEAAGGHPHHGRVLHLEIGQPGHPAPRAAREAAAAALARGAVPYTDALGLRSLRQRIARHYATTYGVALDPARVIVTTGSSAGFQLAFLALFNAGDRVAIARPGYPAYRNILRALDLQPVEIATCPASRHALTPEAIIAADRRNRLAGALVMSPANPTGVVTDGATLRGLMEACRAAGLRFLSDEIYHGLTYGKPAQTALAHGDDVIVLQSFSKFFCMTGWRVGWMIVPEPLIRPIERLQQNLAISVPYLSQVAAEAAFDGMAEMEAVRQTYAENRALLLEGLARMGFGPCLPADGAFYIYADVGHHTNDAVAFCRRILAETGVAITPGVDFDPVDGHRAVRLSFAGATADIRAAIDRLASWLPSARR